MNVDLARARNATVRWRILRILDAGRPLGVSEALIFRVLADVHLAPTAVEVRRQLDYLAKRKLLRLTCDQDAPWLAELTSEGVDVVEYTVPVQPGIARPPNES